MKLLRTAITSFTFVALASTAQATTVAIPTTPASWAAVNPALSTNTGAGSWLSQAQIRYGSQENLFRSPFDGSASAPLSGWENVGYFAVGPSNLPSPATLTYASDQKQFSFLWGSIDSYNYIDFYKGSSLVYSLLASSVAGAQIGIGAAYVTISDFIFNKVTFRSTSEALEFSNISSVSAIPLPAGIALFGSSLGFFGLLALGKRRRLTLA